MDVVSRSPLPDNVIFGVYKADHYIKLLHRDVGIPLKELRKLDLQELYDVVLENVSKDLVELYERLILIDTQTGKELSRHLRHTVKALRPERSILPKQINLVARSEALMGLPLLDPAASVHQIEHELRIAGHGNPVVLEDCDYVQYCVEVNRIVSRRPHGRSPSIGCRPSKQHHENGELDSEVTNAFTGALAALISTSLGVGELTNSRTVGFVSIEAGQEDKFAKLEQSSDLVLMAFEPGRESDGPVNIAVYKQHDGEVQFWPRCSPWCKSDGSQFMLASDDREMCFVFANLHLTALGKVPADDFDGHIGVARRLLKQVASQTQF